MRPDSRRILLWLIVVSAVMAIAVAAWMTSRTHRALSNPPERIRLGTTLVDMSALIWIAEARGYFVENNLDVRIQLYESGFLALRDLVSEQQDFVTAADFPVAEYSLHNRGLRIVTSLDMCDSVRVIAPADSLIRKPQDLKGKRLGVTIGSVAEFYLARLLTMNGLTWPEIEVVNLMPLQHMEAIRKREIDAAMVWEPSAQKMIELLGPDTLDLPGQSGQDLYWLLVCTEETLAKRQSGARRLVSALLQAEDFLDSNEAAGQTIVARRLNLEKRFLEASWERHRFGITLSRPLVLTMEDQCRWLMARNLVGGVKIPNFPHMADVRGLKALKPEAVSIIHWESLHDR
jgi:NitT/TauT family transport system substrate-binding protein